MARPIKETPILYGEDAINFMERAKRVENMSAEERAENLRKLEERVANSKFKFELCW